MPWLSNESKKLIKERDFWKGKAKALAILSPEAGTEQKAAWDMYKKLRNKLNNRKKQEEMLYKSEKMQETVNSPVELWRTAKNLMGWKSTGSPT